MTTATHAVVLLDQPDDEMCENRGWVSCDVPESKARDMLAEFCCDEDGHTPARPVGPSKVVHLRVKNPAAHYEDQRWIPCKPGAKTAQAFWEFDATDTAASSRNEPR